MASDVEHEHEVKEVLHGAVFYPGHAPRRATAEYEHTHHQLVYVLDKPCMICGVRQSTLHDPAQNPSGAKTMQTHHYPVQDSLVEAVDWRKVHADFPQVVSQETLLQFLDSAANMYTVCDRHHIGFGGIHYTSANYWAIQKYLIDGYQLFDETGKPADAAKLISADEHLEEELQAQAAHLAQTGSQPGENVV